MLDRVAQMQLVANKELVEIAVDSPIEVVTAQLETLHAAARDLGCGLDSPFMTLSFLTLAVIPELKLTDLGLVDVRKFDFVPLFEDED